MSPRARRRREFDVAAEGFAGNSLNLRVDRIGPRRVVRLALMIDGARHQATLSANSFLRSLLMRMRRRNSWRIFSRRSDAATSVALLLGHLPGVLLLRSLLRRFVSLNSRTAPRPWRYSFSSRAISRTSCPSSSRSSARGARRARTSCTAAESRAAVAKRLGVHGGRGVEVTKGEPGAVIGHDVAGESRCLVRQATHLELRGEETREQFVVHPNAASNPSSWHRFTSSSACITAGR